MAGMDQPMPTPSRKIPPKAGAFPVPTLWDLVWSEAVHHQDRLQVAGAHPQTSPTEWFELSLSLIHLSKRLEYSPGRGSPANSPRPVLQDQ